LVLSRQALLQPRLKYHRFVQGLDEDHRLGREKDHRREAGWEDDVLPDELQREIGMTTKTPSAASQLKEIAKLRKEIAEVTVDITTALRIARRARDKKAIQSSLNLRKRCKTNLVQLRLVERVINKGSKRVADVFLFANGMVAVTDSLGKQIPKLQDFFLEAIPKLKGKVDGDTKFHVAGGIWDTAWHWKKGRRK
jgi:hypothetical protein